MNTRYTTDLGADLESALGAVPAIKSEVGDPTPSLRMKIFIDYVYNATKTLRGACLTWEQVNAARRDYWTPFTLGNYEALLLPYDGGTVIGLTPAALLGQVIMTAWAQLPRPDSSYDAEMVVWANGAGFGSAIGSVGKACIYECEARLYHLIGESQRLFDPAPSTARHFRALVELVIWRLSVLFEELRLSVLGGERKDDGVRTAKIRAVCAMVLADIDGGEMIGEIRDPLIFDEGLLAEVSGDMRRYVGISSRFAHKYSEYADQLYQAVVHLREMISANTIWYAATGLFPDITISEDVVAETHSASQMAWISNFIPYEAPSPLEDTVQRLRDLDNRWDAAYIHRWLQDHGRTFSRAEDWLKDGGVGSAIVYALLVARAAQKDEMVSFPDFIRNVIAPPFAVCKKIRETTNPFIAVRQFFRLSVVWGDRAHHCVAQSEVGQMEEALSVWALAAEEAGRFIAEDSDGKRTKTVDTSTLHLIFKREPKPPPVDDERVI